MKPVLGIYVAYLGDNEPWWDENSNNMGGSETWAISMSEEFANRGFHVIVFGNPETWHFSASEVEYVPRGLFGMRSEYQHFDYFISSRTVSELTPEFYCPNTYVMSHEANIIGSNTYDDLKMNQVKKIACLSEWHAETLCNLYPGLQRNRIFIVNNGIDMDMYREARDHYSNKKRNMMVWSSCAERGLKNFIDNILPKIRIAVPDFELHVCGYNNTEDKSVDESNGVIYEGRLNKMELADLQAQSKIWVYPNYGLDPHYGGYPVHETFCITAVENAMAGNALICGAASGLRTTLQGYSGLLGYDIGLYDEFAPSQEKLERLNDMLACEAKQALLTDYYCGMLAQEAKSICSKHTWKYAVDRWMEEFNT